MDPNDLLFLHATLAATIRQQQDLIFQLQHENQRLSELNSDASTKTEGEHSNG